MKFISVLSTNCMAHVQPFDKHCSWSHYLPQTDKVYVLSLFLLPYYTSVLNIYIFFPKYIKYRYIKYIIYINIYIFCPKYIKYRYSR